MGRPKGSIGETKLKLLAILYFNDNAEESSYGYGIWKIMNLRFGCCPGDDGLRNIYHHLDNLYNLGLVIRNSNHTIEGAPERHTFGLTSKGRTFCEEHSQYLISGSSDSPQ